MDLLGAPQDLIEKLFPDDNRDKETTSIGVWSDCIESTEVFQYSIPSIQVGWTVYYGVVSGTEILSVARMLHIKRDRWPQVLEDVHFMSSLAANIRNGAAK